MTAIYAGESYAFTISLETPEGVPLDLSTYTCRMAIVEAVTTAATAVARAVTTLVEANTKFLINIQPSETEDLAAKDYYVYVELSKSSTQFAKFFKQALTINPSPFA